MLMPVVSSVLPPLSDENKRRPLLSATTHSREMDDELFLESEYYYQQPTKRQKRIITMSEEETVICRRGRFFQDYYGSNDCYDEIMEGLLYEDDNGGGIRNSWLVQKGDDPGNNTVMMDSTTTTTAAVCAQQQIKSLKQQLIQIKRRLWPASGQCAQVWKSSSSTTTPQKEFWNARAIANPMETLGEKKKRHGGLGQMFINRSAIKLANLDAILDFCLTNPSSSSADNHCQDHHHHHHHQIQPQPRVPFLFADLCGAPGGFSEYIMKRCQSNCHLYSSCRGYGMSLDGSNEHGTGVVWKLCNSIQRDTATRSFGVSYRICKGEDGTGDIYNWMNVLSMQRDIGEDLLRAGIQHRTRMDLVVADGGFDAQRDSECQEELAQKLVLCELAAGLELLDVGGTLVIKLFGCQAESIRMAIRSVHEKFEWTDMIKPISSRPASSERYAVFCGFKGLPSDWTGGPQWISSVMLGQCLQYELPHYSSLDSFLDGIDRDMLVLNLKACFDILSYLHRKTEQGKSNGDPSSLDGNNTITDRYHINVNIYKHAWQLHVLC